MRTVKLGVETLQLCVPDESGLVQVRGPQVFAGYLIRRKMPGHRLTTGGLVRAMLGTCPGKAISYSPDGRRT